MDNHGHILAARLQAARGVLDAVVEEMLSAEQREQLRVALGQVSSNALQRVVNDGVSEEEAALLTHASVEYVSISEMLAVGTGPGTAVAD